MTRFVVILFTFAVGAWAQTASTQILGLVTDATGAVVPGATITARRIETGDVRTTISNNTGNYIFSFGRLRYLRRDVHRRGL